jgi:oligoendopeptidase F
MTDTALPPTLPTDVTEVAWDLETLLPVSGEAGVDQLLAQASTLVERIETRRGTVAELDVADLATLLEDLAELQDVLGRAGNYVGLRFAVDTEDPAVGALMMKVQEQSTQLATKLVWFELEWVDIDDERASELLAAERLAFCAHYLRGLRRYQQHVLSEPEEIILTEKAVSGAGAWSRLFDEQTSAITVDLDGAAVPLDVALAGLNHPEPARRRTVAAAVTEALQPGLRTRGYIFNTLLSDKATDDRLRRYPSWISSRNLSNEASDESVAALMDAVVARYDIPQRWYTAKAQILGLDGLDDWDRYASVGTDDAEFDWADGCELVLDAYGSFSPQLAEVVSKFLAEPWIDAPTRPAKRGGAFCAYTVPSHHPYLLLNWTSKRRDVLTLAHELGHGLHAYLARPQGVFHQMTPLTLAETASVFGETVTFGRLLEQSTDPADRVMLLAEHLEGEIATVFRQVAMCRFEAAVHQERREVGEISLDRFGELWAGTQSEMLGDSVRISDDYRSWWSYIPHFIHTPGYVYSYAYGQLLALSVYARYEAEGPDFVPAYLELLAAGGSRSPEDLGRIVGVDLADPGFWNAGLDIVDRHLAATLEAARAAGRLGD